MASPHVTTRALYAALLRTLSGTGCDDCPYLKELATLIDLKDLKGPPHYVYTAPKDQGVACLVLYESLTDDSLTPEIVNAINDDIITFFESTNEGVADLLANITWRAVYDKAVAAWEKVAKAPAVTPSPALKGLIDTIFTQDDIDSMNDSFEKEDLNSFITNQLIGDKNKFQEMTSKVQAMVGTDPAAYKALLDDALKTLVAVQGEGGGGDMKTMGSVFQMAMSAMNGMGGAPPKLG